jgi:hypothetical protein
MGAGRRFPRAGACRDGGGANWSSKQLETASNGASRQAAAGCPVQKLAAAAAAAAEVVEVVVLVLLVVLVVLVVGDSSRAGADSSLLPFHPIPSRPGLSREADGASGSRAVAVSLSARARGSRRAAPLGLRRTGSLALSLALSPCPRVRVRRPR